MSKTITERIEAARSKKAAAERALRRLGGAIAAERRRQDTRRKILVGALVLSAITEPAAAPLRRLVTAQLGRLPERDRALFGDMLAGSQDGGAL